jgi:hypothetical protein
MKKILYIAALLLSVLSCKEPVDPQPGPEPGPNPPVAEKTLAEKIAGEWHCVVSDMDADIYLSFASDNKFELYQKVGEGAYRLYRGTWSLDEKTAVLTGKYNDGEAWGSGYGVVLSEDGNTLTLDPSADGEDQTYRKESIPADVKDGCVVVVKSDAY